LATRARDCFSCSRTCNSEERGSSALRIPSPRSGAHGLSHPRESLADYRAAKGLIAMESLVVVDHFLTETGRMADGSARPPHCRVGRHRRELRPEVHIGGQGSVPDAATSTGRFSKLASAWCTLPLSRYRRSADLASSLGATRSDLENARNSAPLPRGPHRLRRFRHSDSTSGVQGNIFLTLLLDSVLNKKLTYLGLVR
jgi:hypothetical protein